MTEIERKALALVNEVYRDQGETDRDWAGRNANPVHEALCRAIERLEATEARHAAELREQAERFSDVAARVKRFIEEAKLSRLAYDCPDGSTPSFLVDALAPFILPRPDPLLEAEKLISTLRADEREGYAVAGQAAETISNLVAALRAQQKDTNA